ncbi:MAG: hypothetical protein WC243_01900 [Patescibacteria group bacterium]|jgi:hypothetical protein
MKQVTPVLLWLKGNPGVVFFFLASMDVFFTRSDLFLFIVLFVMVIFAFRSLIEPSFLLSIAASSLVALVIFSVLGIASVSERAAVWMYITLLFFAIWQVTLALTEERLRKR